MTYLDPDPLTIVEADDDLYPEPPRHITVPLVLACVVVALFVLWLAFYGGTR